jgi:hypothetical protein
MIYMGHINWDFCSDCIHLDEEGCSVVAVDSDFKVEDSEVYCKLGELKDQEHKK